MARLVFGNSDCFIPPLTALPHGASNVQWRHNLPTPPNSTRPSLESPNGLAKPRPTSDAHFKQLHLHQLPNRPTPAPLQGTLSSPSLGSVIDAVREVAEGHQQGCRIDDVTPELYKQLEAHAVNDGYFEGWEGLRCVPLSLSWRLAK
jgi:hypothetical protein